jgi:hypothetical protein
MTRETLLGLADRCEQATGPDRELDCEIWADANDLKLEWQGNCLVAGIEGVIGWIDPGEHSRNFSTNRSATGPAAIPAYTASLDAAMTLVPEGWEVALYWGMSGFKPEAQLERDELRLKNPGFEPISGTAETIALALCAAALRARASL